MSAAVSQSRPDRTTDPAPPPKLRRSARRVIEAARLAELDGLCRTYFELHAAKIAAIVMQDAHNDTDAPDEAEPGHAEYCAERERIGKAAVTADAAFQRAAKLIAITVFESLHLHDCDPWMPFTIVTAEHAVRLSPYAEPGAVDYHDSEAQVEVVPRRRVLRLVAG